MKLTWKGEEGAPDFINIGGYKLRPGKAVEVPDELAAAYALNSYFEVQGKVDPAQADAAKKAAEVQAAEQEVAAAQADVTKAADAGAKEAASKRLAAAQAKLDAAKKD